MSLLTGYILTMFLTTADYFQTQEILNSNGAFLERNPMITQHNVHAYFGTLAIVNTALYYKADTQSKYALAFIAGIEAKAVTNNYLIGVRVGF